MELKLIYAGSTLLMVGLAYVVGYFIGHGIMLHDCQDIMSSALPVPNPILAFKQ